MKIALVGIGTVGQGAYEILQNRKEEIKQALGEEVEVSYIVVRESRVEEYSKKWGNIVTSDYEKVLEEVDAVAEATGAKEAGYEYMKKALEKKVAVITANKSVVSAYFEELTALSQKNNTPFLFEAAVGGGIPVLTPLRQLLVSNEVEEVNGVLNGTCNYLLNKMFAEDADYGETLALCQDLGYAEKDPTDDVEGFDTMRKLRIVTTMALGEIQEEDILVRGISQINKDIVAFCKKNHWKIKLVATAKKEENRLSALVEPVVMEENHPMAALPLAINTLRIKGDSVGDLAFEGPGAGKEPTGNAMVADILDSKMYGGYPLMKKEGATVHNDGFKGKYLVFGNKVPEEMVESKQGDFIITKEVLRQELMKHLEKDQFFARMEV